MNKKQEAEIEERILQELEEEAKHPKDPRVKIEIKNAPEDLKAKTPDKQKQSQAAAHAGKKAETAQKEISTETDDTNEADEPGESLSFSEDEQKVSAEDEQTTSAAEQDAPSDNGQSIIDEKRGFFGGKKKDKSKEKIDALTAQIAELQDKDLRRQAEFDNFRKRTDKEKAAQFESGEASVIEHILPVIDNFERGFAMVEDDDKEDAFVDGMNKVYKQLMAELEKIGVKPIEAVGKEFDPNIHNAVMQVDTGEYESGFVAQEMQKGYMFHDLVIRHSMVAVQS